jgi:redox-sensitive bicupin YhaK (pirin superfamily)
MSAGSGITHAEYNLEPEATQIFQIWIQPTQAGGKPSWGTRPFPRGERAGGFVTLASGRSDDGDALPIRADARVVAATLKAGESAEYRLGKDRFGYLVPATGEVEIDGLHIGARDGAAISDVEWFKVTAIVDSEIVLVDAA